MGRARKQQHGKPEAQGRHTDPGADAQLTRQAATSWRHHQMMAERDAARKAARK